MRKNPFNRQKRRNEPEERGLIYIRKTFNALEDTEVALKYCILLTPLIQLQHSTTIYSIPMKIHGAARTRRIRILFPTSPAKYTAEIPRFKPLLPKEPLTRAVTSARYFRQSHSIIIPPGKLLSKLTSSRDVFEKSVGSICSSIHE